jgi:hypothetical protein
MNESRSTRNYDIPIRMLDPMAFDAAAGQAIAPADVGGLAREEKVLPIMVVATSAA